MIRVVSRLFTPKPIFPEITLPLTIGLEPLNVRMPSLVLSLIRQSRIKGEEPLQNIPSKVLLRMVQLVIRMGGAVSNCKLPLKPPAADAPYSMMQFSMMLPAPAVGRN